MKERKKLFIVFSFALILRLLFLNWNSAEYTDSIFFMTMFAKVRSSAWPPLYPALIQAFNLLFRDLELSGKLISIIAGAMTVLPIFYLGRKIYDEQTGLYAALLFSVTPVALRWNIRVMTDSMFVFLFLLSLWYLLEFYSNYDRNKLILSTFISGLAIATKYQGLVLLPLLVVAFLIYIRKNGWRKVFPVLGGWVSWLIVIFWLYHQGCEQWSHYQKSMQTTPGYAPLICAETYLTILPYILTYPVFIFTCYGLFKSKNQKLFLAISGYLIVALLIAHSFYYSFQTRYWLSIIPILLILAAYGITSLKEKSRRIVLTICILCSLIFSLAVLYFQRDTYGDLKRSALYIRDHLRGKTIFSDETIKTSFWAEVPIKMFDLENIKPDSYVVLHSLYTQVYYPQAYPNLAREIKTFMKDYKLKKIYETKSEIVPLLPDIMSSPPFTNHPGWASARYQRQYFHSVIFRVESKLE